jgi:hypothetical protein
MLMTADLAFGSIEHHILCNGEQPEQDIIGGESQTAIAMHFLFSAEAQGRDLLFLSLSIRFQFSST